MTQVLRSAMLTMLQDSFNARIMLDFYAREGEFGGWRGSTSHHGEGVVLGVCHWLGGVSRGETVENSNAGLTLMSGWGTASNLW